MWPRSRPSPRHGTLVSTGRAGGPRGLLTVLGNRCQDLCRKGQEPQCPERSTHRVRRWPQPEEIRVRRCLGSPLCFGHPARVFLADVMQGVPSHTHDPHNSGCALGIGTKLKERAHSLSDALLRGRQPGPGPSETRLPWGCGRLQAPSDHQRGHTPMSAQHQGPGCVPLPNAWPSFHQHPVSTPVERLRPEDPLRPLLSHIVV